MTMDLAVVSPDQLFTLAERVSKSSLVPQAYRGKPIDTAIAMMYGAEMGLPPMTSLQRVVVISGKPTLDAQGMVALIRSHGHSLSGDVNNESAVVTGKRLDTGDAMTVTFTMDDARQAELLKNATYRKHPTDMLWARAVTQIARRLFADVLMGASYAPEEMEVVVESGAPDPVHTPPPTNGHVIRRASPLAMSAADKGGLENPVIDIETGELTEDVVDAEVIEKPSDDEAHALAEAKTGLTEVIKGIDPPAERNRVLKHLEEKFGSPASRSLDQIQEATKIAAGWEVAA